MSSVCLLTQLTSLRLHSCNLNDAALKKLSVLTGLQELDVQFDKAVKGGMGTLSCLAASLPHLTSLQLPSAVTEKAVLSAFGGRVVESRAGLYALAPADSTDVATTRKEDQGRLWWRGLLHRL